MTRRGRISRVSAVVAIASFVGLLSLGIVTRGALRPLPESLGPVLENAVRARVLDRRGGVLAVTLENPLNLHDTVPLHRIPERLRDAFVLAEDQRFFEHRGVDWTARANAVAQNLLAARAVRGASTISEQTVRILHPRPRNLWSRWLEGFEARQLERRFDKAEILEFYLNQVPYARRRRGVVQAARDYFDRDLATLNLEEVLALAVLVRSPSRFDLRRGTAAITGRVERLAARMHAAGRIDDRQFTAFDPAGLQTVESAPTVEAPHLVRHVRGLASAEGDRPAAIRTFIDPLLQARVTAALEGQIDRLVGSGVGDGAAVVIDHRHDEVLVWANAGNFFDLTPGSRIDAVLARRQPGSTLKPFLYSMALEGGWTAATVIDDAPLARPVGSGLHQVRNYARTHHGPLRLREALANSLNVPAVRTLEHWTPRAFLAELREFGFESLDLHPETYGEGLALGNGEVSLYELVRGYATLARGGIYRRSRLFEGQAVGSPIRVRSEEVSSIIGDILSDPQARSLEFSGGLLDFPGQTAVKTGTSNDYRDAWAVGFDHRFTAGVWMGNLDRRAMDGVTGAVGPAVVLREIFAELRGADGPQPLPMSRSLARSPVCRRSGQRPVAGCARIEEWFRPGQAPTRLCALHAAGPDLRPGSARLQIVRPTPGLQLALDPRIPDRLEAFEFELDPSLEPHETRWLVDGQVVAVTGTGQRRVRWGLQPGTHTLEARIRRTAADGWHPTGSVRFHVQP